MANRNRAADVSLVVRYMSAVHVECTRIRRIYSAAVAASVTCDISSVQVKRATLYLYGTVRRSTCDNAAADRLFLTVHGTCYRSVIVSAVREP